LLRSRPPKALLTPRLQCRGSYCWLEVAPHAPAPVESIGLMVSCGPVALQHRFELGRRSRSSQSTHEPDHDIGDEHGRRRTDYLCPACCVGTALGIRGISVVANQKSRLISQTMRHTQPTVVTPIAIR
jgi:hypothetical protein